MKKGVLKRFSQGLRKLRHLRLSFEIPNYKPSTAVCLYNVLPFNLIGLQSITLQNEDAAEDLFISFLTKNAKTLRQLELDHISLEPKGSGWYRGHDDLDQLLESYLLHGGPCPLEKYSKLNPRTGEPWDQDMIDEHDD
ncbi:hypothetical protein K458DRAFT_157269 [Lentithecium fluviatile CBS 122367]|uniref:Uncharacterized protein n=1 Tax=Lentithecium fluviatile CBS 122367 TaxID=1168545 RepID=A0A6G1IHZ2_9PLEO|nr:hypothetical protein K458DRAFT_157269 [Lentithecium fluviatile CBS 122367]